MHWKQFVMPLGALDPDRLESAFADQGALAVTLTDAGDDPVLEPAPGETPLWSHTLVTALFPADADLENLPAALRAALAVDALPEYRIESLADRLWEREWLRDYRPMKFGRRLWVCPAGLEVDADAAVVVRLDPGLAFGTGTHPTTALCLEWLDGLALDGASVLDYGCGSGILGIAAALLGAARVDATDIDPQAITATRENAGANGVAGRIETSNDPAAFVGEYDVIVANILAAPLIELAGPLTRRLAPGGRIALSGLLEQQVADVSAAYRRRVHLDPPAIRDGWARLTGIRR